MSNVGLGMPLRRARCRAPALVYLFLLPVTTASSVAAAQATRVVGPAAERDVVQAALALVPESLHWPVVVIDPEGVADPEAVRRLDAFTVREANGELRPKIYLNRQSPLVREATRGVDFYVKVLAAVIVHEAAHLDGASEAEARAEELTFLEELVNRGLVRTADGGRYRLLLKGRPHTAPSS